MAYTFVITRQVEARLREMCARNTHGQSTWIFTRTADVYLRVTQRLSPHGGLIPTLDLANISVHGAPHKRGVFRQVLRAFERVGQDTGRAVFVEQVLNPILDAALIRYGYIPKEPQGEIQCYWSPNVASIPRREVP